MSQLIDVIIKEIKGQVGKITLWTLILGIVNSVTIFIDTVHT